MRRKTKEKKRKTNRRTRRSRQEKERRKEKRGRRGEEKPKVRNNKCYDLGYSQTNIQDSSIK